MLARTGVALLRTLARAARGSARGMAGALSQLATRVCRGLLRTLPAMGARLSRSVPRLGRGFRPRATRVPEPVEEDEPGLTAEQHLLVGAYAMKDRA